MVIAMATLVAQILAPNTQPGPLRLPAIKPQTTTVPNQDREKLEIDQGFELPNPNHRTEKQDEAKSDHTPEQEIRVKGELPYRSRELIEILGTCAAEDDIQTRLAQCAASLTAQLVADGYINSRVLVTSNEEGEQLELIKGRITEIRVSGASESLNNAVYNRLEQLRSGALNVFELDQKLTDIRQDRLIQKLQARLKRLGSQVSETALIVDVEPRQFSWQGFVQISNDGSSSTGELRGVGILSKEDIVKARDTLLLFSEIGGSGDPDFGSFLGSISYRYPISSEIDLTLTGGYSHRRLIESPSNNSLISYRMKQGSIQLNWNILQSSQQIWSVFGSFSGDQSRLFIDGRSIGKEASLDSIQRKPTSAYARFGLSGLGAGSNHRWMTSLFAIQGIAASVPERQRELRLRDGIDVGKALAVGGQAGLEWDLSDRLMFKANIAGQIAVQPLLPSMGFVVGADQGLIGLPSQWISGDSGWLGVAELPWTFADSRQGTFQLVPYLGGGGVQTEVSQIIESNSVISYGLFVRYQNNEKNFHLDLGVVDITSESIQRSSSVLLNQGLSIKTSYRF